MADQYILLNIAMESSTDAAFTQSEMLIDSVRMYQEEPPAPQTVLGTFSVDMRALGTSVVDEVYVSGNFNDWCTDCNSLSDSGSGIWTVQMPADINEDIYYHYLTRGNLTMHRRVYLISTALALSFSVSTE